MDTDKNRISALECRMYRLEILARELLQVRPAVGTIECPTCLLPVSGERLINCRSDGCASGLNNGVMA